MNHPRNPILTLLRRATPYAALLLATTGVYAQQSLSINLRGAGEVPAVNTTASGSGQITVTTDRSVSGTIKTSGMSSTMAHIHEGAIGKNGPPIVTLTKTGEDSYAVPAGTKLTDDQYASYMAGNLYINVHSAAFPGGEIRAQLVRMDTAATPARPGY